MRAIPKTRKFDLSDEAWERSLPPTGVYDATIVSARASEKDENAWLAMVYEVVDADGVIHRLEDLLNVEALGSTPRLARDKGRLRTILTANGRPISFDSADQVSAPLIGCRASIVVGRRIREGLPVPAIESVGPASDTPAPARLGAAE